MFGSRTRSCVIFAVIAACASIALATTYTLSGDFKETRETFSHAYMSGKFYYKYDDQVPSNSRLLFEYNLDKGTVSNLYDYGLQALYSMCDNGCSADSFAVDPTAWWKNNNLTRTNDQKDGLYWYTYNQIGKPQVVKMLISDHTDPKNNDYKLKEIEFSDGRLVAFSNVVVDDPNIDQSKFQHKSGCPEPTCAVFSDIIFVLDYSGSVSADEWTQATNFAVQIVQSFKFGENDAAGAAVQFNGAGYNPGIFYDHPQSEIQCNATTKVDRYSADWDFDYPSSQSVIAGHMTNKKETVTKCDWVWKCRWGGCGYERTCTNSKESIYELSTTAEELIADLELPREPVGGTCLGFGFDRAMKLFDTSPRKNFSPPPQRIVIFITDGADWCPNGTRESARKLREEYDATLIGVGVGLECEYDKDFIKSIASKLLIPTYFDVDDYSKIQEVADKIFKPICEEFHSGCGPSCKGFCGCGECWCPSCEDVGSACYNYKCDVQSGTSNGCLMQKIAQQPNPNTTCTEYKCVTKEVEGRRTADFEAVELCADKEALYPGRCRSVICNDDDGTCNLHLDHDLCDREFSTNCIKWKCADDNERIDDADSGCRVFLDKDEQYKNEAKESGEDACFYVKCNEADGERVKTDLCVLNNTACHTYTCVAKGEKQYECLKYDIPAPENSTACKKYACDDVNGWEVVEEHNADSCAEDHKKANNTLSCKIFYCDPDSGCSFTAFYEECNEECDSLLTECINDAKSTVTQCQIGNCKVRDNGGSSQAYCFIASDIDCTNSSQSNVVEQAEALNKANPDVCFSIGCKSGQCILINAPKPVPDNKCYKQVCRPKAGEIGMWDWVTETTDIYDNCKSDACYDRVCDNNLGCNQTDKCRIKSNECYSYTCNDVDGVKTCESKSLLNLMNYTCLNETCINGKKETVKLNVEEVCAHVNKCEVVTCSKAGKCVYTPKLPPDDDPCKIYSCDPTTGEYSYVPKCNDGIYCTEDKCTIDGDCRFMAINCYLEIDMTDYPCFRAECREDSNNYRCMRKLRPGVYIDVCGNCIKEDGTSSSDEGAAMTACTDAPEQPLNKEGLAAASIALIVLGAIVIGAAIATSGVLGTKTLLERAKAADNQSAHSNPLYEDTDTEMQNPGYTGGDQ